MRQFHAPGTSTGAPHAGRERRKLVWLLLGLVFVVVGYLAIRLKQDEYGSQEEVDLSLSDLEMEETVLLPDIDAARIDALVEDGAPVDRVMIEGEALDLLLADARTLTTRHFEAMGTEELDAAKVAEILADPSAHRARPYMGRGLVDSMRVRRRGPLSEEEYTGRIVLEDDSIAYFLVLDAPANGGFVRVDGLFLKVYSDEDEFSPGEWVEGPLLVGPRVIRSYRALGEVTEPHWGLYSTVEDADLVPGKGVEPRIVRDTPFDALWHMMAYARDVPADAIDWEAAPVLNRDNLASVVREPERWRAQPFQIPLSRIQDARVIRAGENPARIESYTRGWIGNTTWTNVVQFKSPIPDHELRLGDYALGRGFFLHELAYESAGRGLRVAPLFILQSLTRYEPQVDPLFRQLGYAVGAIAVLLVVLFAVLLARDKRKAQVLQREMVRRRQARRARQRSVGTASS